MLHFILTSLTPAYHQPHSLSKGIQDSLGFWIPRRGFRVLSTAFQSFSVELGLWIPTVSGILDSLGGIRDSKAQDSSFQLSKIFPGSGMHHQKFWRILESVSLTWGKVKYFSEYPASRFNAVTYRRYLMITQPLICWPSGTILLECMKYLP